MDVGIGRKRKVELHVSSVGGEINEASMNSSIVEIADGREDEKIVNK